MRLVKKIFGQAFQSNIIAVKVVRHGQIDMGSRSSRWIGQLMVASESRWQFWCTCKGDTAITAAALAAWRWSSGGGLGP